VAVQRYVESLVTGNFWQVQKEIGLQDSKDEAKMIVQSNRENYEREMKEVQRLWINRIHKLFHLFLGLLAGMSLIHLIVINNTKSKE
jgi:polynucleotide 5'-kinase involved in rRNA processing